MLNTNGFNPQFKAEEIAEEMLKLFGDRVVDPDIYPRQFLYQAKFASYQLYLKQEGLLK